tara:strand:- start:7 stop:240 length:234 start_codon:yes stop_codon:yes gene_type:complete
MYFLALGLLVLSTWYILKLFNNFNNDPLARKEIDLALKVAKKEAKAKNPFAPGRIRTAFETYNKENKFSGSKNTSDN